MLKKIIKSICLSLFLIVACGVLSACCGVKDPVVKVNYIDVAEELGLTSYSKTIELGEDYSFDLVIPEGFEHEGINVMINGDTPMDLAEPIYSDAVVAEENPEYRYSLEKLIKIQLNRVTRDVTLDIDMSKVRRKSFELKVSSSVLEITKTIDERYNKEYSNLSVVSVDPSSLNHLVRLDSSNILAKREFYKDTATVYYGEYIVLCYTKPYEHSEINSLYRMFPSDKDNFFIEKSEMEILGNFQYLKFDVATMGNMYYNLSYNDVTNTSTRLFYLGRINESYQLDNKITGYHVEQNIILDNDYNKFSLLTNRQKFNSDLLTIKVYEPTASSEIVIRDGENEIPLKEVKSTGTYKGRYDRFDMYIGDNQQEDNLLADNEKGVLPTKLYVSVSSSVIKDFDDMCASKSVKNPYKKTGNISDYLHINFLHYEKQDWKSEHVKDVELVDVDNNGARGFVAIDIDTLRSYVDVRYSEEGVEYLAGNAILYVNMDEIILDDARTNKILPYSIINYPIYTSGQYVGVNSDYKAEFYISNDDCSTRNYGFLDIDGIDEDRVFFRTKDIVFSSTFEEANIYLDLMGPEKNLWHNVTISQLTNIKINNQGSALFEENVTTIENTDCEDCRNCYGLLKQKISLMTRRSLDQYRLDIYLMTTGNDGREFNMTFNNSKIGDGTIYMSNDINFGEGNVANITANAVNKGNIVKFGIGKDIFYYVASDIELDFDIWLKDGIGDNEEISIISGTKKLLDIAGNEVKTFAPNGKQYTVYVKYQNVNVYGNEAREYICVAK